MKDSNYYNISSNHKLSSGHLVSACVVGALILICAQSATLFDKISIVGILTIYIGNMVRFVLKDSSLEVQNYKKQSREDSTTADPYAILPCIRERRSIFPSEYDATRRDVDPLVIKSLLKAALWSPWHGKCKGYPHPARFVVLGPKAMEEMQMLTLEYYDKNWRSVGWGSGKVGTEEEYKKWRQMTEGEIAGRWGSCSYMIGIIMQRQTGATRLPEWEEAAATATAVHNLHLQSTKFPSLACYWSSWHDAARDSTEMKTYLKMGPEDKCMGFFIVAQVKKGQKDRRKRDASLLRVEWRN